MSDEPASPRSLQGRDALGIGHPGRAVAQPVATRGEQDACRARASAGLSALPAFARQRAHRDARSRRLFLRSRARSEEHTSELQSLMRISYAVFCLKKKKIQNITNINEHTTHS